VKIEDFTPQAFIWPNTGDVLSVEDAKRVVILGFSLNGDWIAFVAGAPERILVFPRNAGPIVELPSVAHVLGKYRRDEED
jgi:hypothetical protein